jgi:hypothetical protein
MYKMIPRKESLLEETPEVFKTSGVSSGYFTNTIFFCSTNEPAAIL